MKSAFKSFAEAFEGGRCALAGGSKAPEDRRPTTEPDEGDLAMMADAREKTWKFLLKELEELSRGRSNPSGETRRGE